MARPIRIEIAGALYHDASRGDLREAIFEDDTVGRSSLKCYEIGSAPFGSRPQGIAYAIRSSNSNFCTIAPDSNPSLNSSNQTLSGRLSIFRGGV